MSGIYMDYIDDYYNADEIYDNLDDFSVKNNSDKIYYILRYLPVSQKRSSRLKSANKREWRRLPQLYNKKSAQMSCDFYHEYSDTFKLKRTDQS